MTPSATARLTLLALAALALLGSSCRRGPRCYPVRGQVLVDGQPAAGALVVLVPADAKDPAAPRPSATTGADGSFALRTYDSATGTLQDGAPPGAYVATVLWPPEGAGGLLPDTAKGEIRDRLQGRYSDPATSKLSAQVKDSSTVLEPFRLAGPGPKGPKR